MSADFSDAIQRDPGGAFLALNDRGNAYEAVGEYDRAIADFDAAIHLNPNDAAVLGNRANTYAAHGQFESAVADFSAAIKLEPTTARLYVNRARAELYLGQTDAAAADVKTDLTLNPSDAYAVIWLHLAHVEAAVDDLHELARNSTNVDHKKWPGPVVDLHLGATSPETFNKASLSNVDAKVRPERTCEVAFYLGTFYLERRDRVQAKRHLEAAVNACPPSLIELGAAKAELIRLQSIP